MALLKRRGVSLSAFVRGIVSALCEGQQAMPEARTDHLNQHMDVGDDGVYRPKLINFEISEGRTISVSTYSMSQVNVIGINRAKVTCSARLVDLDTEHMTGQLSQDGQSCNLYVNPSLRKSKSIEIEIEFCQRPHSESEHRLLESLDGIVVEQSES